MRTDGVLIEGESVYVSYSFLQKKGISKKVIESWKTRDVGVRKRVQNRVFILYSSIPAPSLEKLPSETALRGAIQREAERMQKAALNQKEKAKFNEQQQQIEAYLNLFQALITTEFTQYRPHYQGYVSEKKVDQYAKTEALYRELVAIKQDHPRHGSLIYEALQLLEKRPFKLSCQKNSFSTRFWCKMLSEVSQAIERGCLPEYIRPGYLHNDNARHFDDTHQAIIYGFYSQGKKMSVRAAWKQYCLVCAERGWESVSYSTVKGFLRSDYAKSIIAPLRHGRSFNENKHRPFARRGKPNYSFSLVSGDGWFPGRIVTVNFTNPKTGETHQKAQTVAVWLWFDWLSKAVISYEIAPTETYELIRQSFRHIFTLHWDICPSAIYIDKKWRQSKDVKRLFERAGVDIQEKRAYNPKENIAERFNKELNKIHRHIDEGWVPITHHHQNFTHNSDLKRAPMSESEFRKLVLSIVNIYNNEPLDKFDGKSRLQVLTENLPAAPRTIDPFQRTVLFGRSTLVKVRNRVFVLEVGTRKYEYEVPQWHEYIGKTQKDNRVRVCYDESFLETVDIFKFQDEMDSTSDTYLTSCPRTHRFNPATHEQTEQDKKVIGHQQKRERAYDQFADQGQKKYETILDNTDLRTSMKQAGQDLFKEAQSTEMAKHYSLVMEDRV